jgi:hypothetical protein
MEYRQRVYLLSSLVVGCLALMLAGAALVLMHVPPGTIELNAARQRWARRSFSHYRMVLEYGEMGYCRQSIDVKDQHVVTLLQNTCSQPAPTVEELFDRIEQDIRRLNGRCGTNGCGCDGTFVVSATYDSQLGYPASNGSG